MLRGVAILAVFLFHCLGASFGFSQLPWNGLFPGLNASATFCALLPCSYGWAGVALFFVISGFCIHLSHVRSGEKGFGRFFVRRFFRIYPAYLVCVLAFFFIPPWNSMVGWSLGGAAQLASHLLLVQNISSRSLFGINPSFWSIAVEVQLYALYPVLLAMISRFGWKRTLLILTVLELSLRSFGAAYQISTGQSGPIWVSLNGFPLAFWMSWSLGAYLAEMYMIGEKMPFAEQPLWLWTAIAFGTQLFRPTAALTFPAFCFLSAIFISKALNNAEATAAQATRPWSRTLRFVGVVSYSFYLIHQPLVLLVASLANRLKVSTWLNTWKLFLLCLALFPIIAFLSWSMYELLEKRSISVGKSVLALMPRGLQANQNQQLNDGISTLAGDTEHS